MKALDLNDLRKAVQGESVAVRLVQRLQPAGGHGDKVFPPTYATDDRMPLRYAVEKRKIDGTEKDCVLLDSVASQANRMEECLLEAWEGKALDFPVVGVDFSPYEDLADIGFLTTLQAPHRIADALLRDSLVDSDPPIPFRDSDPGRKFTFASVRDATALFRLCPTALIFGVWDSTGPRGGQGAKFQRALVSEIVGVDYSAGVKTASRIDPAGIQANVNIYHRADDESDWTANVDEAKKGKRGEPIPFSRSGAEGKGKPSAVNHSNVAPSIDAKAGGVTIDYALHTAVLSLPALRRLRFPTDFAGTALESSRKTEAEVAVRTALASLAIAALALMRERGYDLRSRSLLVPEANSHASIEFLPASGADPVHYALDVDHACQLVKEASGLAASYGFEWTRQPLILKPMPKLVELIRRSRALAASGNAEEEAS